LALAAGTLLSVSLSGCGWFSSSSSSSSADAGPACPTAVVLRPLAQTAVFGAQSTQQGHRPLDVGFYGRLSDVDVKCQGSGDTLRALLDIVVVGERGPSAHGDGVDLEYFVAVTGTDQSILSKKNFPIHIAIPGDSKRAAVTDHIEEAIALGGRRPADVTINVGFQQSPEVVQFFRNFRGPIGPTGR
jgi:hypothetical protein